MGWRELLGINTDGTKAAPPKPEANARADKMVAALKDKVPAEEREKIGGAIFKPADVLLLGQDSYTLTVDATFSRKHLIALGLKEIVTQEGKRPEVETGDFIRRAGAFATDFIVKANRLDEVLGIETPARVLA